MSISELLSYLLLIIIGYCMGKILLNRYESYGPSPSPPPRIVSSEEEICSCYSNEDNKPYKQKAYFNGKDHADPFKDYCNQFSNDKSGCEDVFYYDIPFGPYKICRFDAKNKKCTSDGAIDCDYFDFTDATYNNKKCTNPPDQQKMCCSTREYN